MIPPKINGYVLAEDFRVLNRWISPICAVIIILFSIVFLKPAFFEMDNKIPNLIAAVVFLIIGLFMLGGSYKNSNILSLSYSCEKALITTQCKHGMHSLDINRSFYITNLSVAFFMKGTWFEEFIILSNQPFSRIPNLENGGLQVIENLWSQGVIILPANDEIRTWIKLISEVNQIPQYPKVAYLQRNDS